MSSKECIDGMCMVALALTTITMCGVTFHSFVMRALISGWVFVVLQLLESSENVSLQYVNSIDCTMKYEVGIICGGLLYGWPIILSVLGLSLAWPWHASLGTTNTW